MKKTFARGLMSAEIAIAQLLEQLAISLDLLRLHLTLLGLACFVSHHYASVEPS